MSFMVHHIGMISSSLPSVDFIDSDGSATDSSSYSFTDFNFGLAHPSRDIIIAVGQRSTSGTRQVTALTIGGVSATRIFQLRWNSNQNEITFWYARVPTGASGTVAVSLDGTASRCFIAGWSAIGLKSLTPVDTDNPNNAASDTLNASIDVEDGGYILAFALDQLTPGTATWTGLDEVVDTEVELIFTAAWRRFPSAATVTPSVVFTTSSVIGAGFISLR